MAYECVGCGKIEQYDPPRDVMPRFILDHWSIAICSICKRDLEGHLEGKYADWVRERRLRIQKARQPSVR